MMEQAIKKAIEGGYRKDIVQSHADLCSCGGSITCAGKEHYNSANIYKICLDPLFWQALGKQQGWGKSKPDTSNGECLGCRRYVNEDHICPEANDMWLINWKWLIDWIADGKSADSFFEGLLK